MTGTINRRKFLAAAAAPRRRPRRPGSAANC